MEWTDGQWDQGSKKKTGNPHPESQVNWASRDENWSKLLRAAAMKIKENISLRRVTRNEMISQAGISTLYLPTLIVFHHVVQLSTNAPSHIRLFTNAVCERKGSK